MTLSYSVPSAAKATGLSAQQLRDAIHKGELRARKSSRDETTGEPTGKFVVLAGDLSAYLDSLPEA